MTLHKKSPEKLCLSKSIWHNFIQLNVKAKMAHE